MEKRRVFTVIGYIAGSLALFLAIFFTVAHFTFAYYEQEKVFQKSGLSITLTNEFKEKEDTQYTARYSSKKILVLTYKAEFNNFNIEEWDPAEHSAYDYAEWLAEYYKGLYPATSEIFTEQDLIYFTLEFEKSESDKKYIIAVYKSNDAYWQVNLCCRSIDYESLQSEMLGYAQTVSFEG